jgi:DNA-binding transcriptional ArsR family regulator
MAEVTVQGILHALSDPVRARIFMELAASEGRNCVAFLNVSREPLPKSSLSLHFKTLREAGLIRSERRGVELQNFTHCEELQKTFGDMINSILKAYDNQDGKPEKRPREGLVHQV